MSFIRNLTSSSSYFNDRVQVASRANTGACPFIQGHLLILCDLVQQHLYEVPFLNPWPGEMDPLVPS